MTAGSALQIRLLMAVMTTGTVAAIAVPVAAYVLRNVAVDLEIELNALVATLLQNPWLGAIPGLFALASGAAALGVRPLRVPLLLIGIVSNLLAVGCLVMLLLNTMSPLYVYEPL